MSRRESGVNAAVGLQSGDLESIRTLWICRRRLTAIQIRSAIDRVQITATVLSHRNAAWVEVAGEVKRLIQFAGPSQTDQMSHWLSIEMGERSRYVELTRTAVCKGDAINGTIEPLTKAIGHASVCM